MRPSISIVVLALALTPAAVRADWAPEGNPVCNIAGVQHPVRSAGAIFQMGIAGPYAAGTFVVWQDQRADGGDLYFNVLFDGVPPDPAPGADGFPFVVAPGNQPFPVVTEVMAVPNLSQVQGPAFVVAWSHSDGANDIRAKRYGDAMDWGDTGVPVDQPVGFSPSFPDISRDGGRGAIVTWLDVNSAQHLVRAQRLDSLGTRQWGANGVAVGTDTTVQGAPRIAPGPDRGAYVARTDNRLGGSILGPRSLVLYRLDGSGATAAGWPAGGVVLGEPRASSYRVLPDVSGGAYVAWIEPVPLSDASSGLEVRMTRIQSDGTPAAGWSLAGTPVVTRNDGHCLLSDLGGDGAGGVVLAIEYEQVVGGPSASGRDLLAQRLLPGGSRPPGWPAAGIVLAGAPGAQTEARLFGQAGGLLAAWRDERSGEADLYAMRLLPDGGTAEGWPAHGLLLCGASGAQSGVTLQPNNTGGALFVWQDQRDPLTGPDLYFHTVTADGRLDVPRLVVPTVHLSTPRPCPARAGVELTWWDSVRKVARIEVLDTQGRRINSWREDVGAGATRLTWDLRDEAGRAVPAGIYQFRVSTARAARSRPVIVTR